jgi:hypothetical protein
VTTPTAQPLAPCPICRAYFVTDGTVQWCPENPRHATEPEPETLTASDRRERREDQGIYR